MKNTQSKLSQTLTPFCNTRHCLILTGPPVVRLSFTLPKIFNSMKSSDTPFANFGTGDKMPSEEEALLIIR